jgi:hypothetical protein
MCGNRVPEAGDNKERAYLLVIVAALVVMAQDDPSEGDNAEF